MSARLVCLALLIACASTAPTKIAKDVTELRIGVKFKPEGCATAQHAKPGDMVYVHYT